MNTVVWLFIGAFGCMFVGFALQLVKAWIDEIRYNAEKRKAIKENSPDKWVYKI